MNTTKERTRIRRAAERGHTQAGWLDSYHSFSFGGYRDEEFDQFGVLRVINQDRVAPASGFPAHPHRDMEIISLVLEGQLEHKDSMGNGSTIHANEIQYMSAGSGIVHSEYNPSESDAAHFLQIWFEPDRNGYEPQYKQVILNDADLRNRWTPLLSPVGQSGLIEIRQHAWLYRSKLSADTTLDLPELQGCRQWIQVIDGSIQANEHTLHPGDAFAQQSPSLSKIKALAPSDILIFDLK